ncbi:12766_t:CDS:1 [Cetraspora pellucida]|uniref:12766_t:CDS:1 n=1 Tax=Cetraspora pellucida TaxID=1433469 RepID=A0ACA9JVY7_9GLOM|nr:12766_t:CDS:1 [Cetraspora pellucida]
MHTIKNKKLDHVVKFIDNSTPNKFNQKLTILFLPLSSNYPGVDFLIWDSKGKILYAFQITIGLLNNHIESKKKFMTGNLIDKWAFMCEVKRKDVKFVWIAPRSVLENSTDSLHLTFSCIKDRFPALDNLRLQS